MLPILLALLVALPGAAQPPARKKAAPAKTAPAKTAKADSWPLTGITFKGNRLYTSPQLTTLTGLQIGQNAAKKDFEAARERLLHTGAFENIAFQFGPDSTGTGIVATFEIDEVEQVFPYRFEELPAPEADLRALIKQREPLFDRKMPGTREFLDRVSAEIKEYVAARGFQDNVVGKILPDTPGNLAIVFRPATAPPSIGEVKFSGNEVLPAATLNNAFGLVAVGVPYSEKRIRELLESSIRPLYEQHGRLAVAFPKVTTTPMKNVEGVSVTVQVTEGPLYKFGEIKVLGSSLTSRELLKAANLKSGDPSNFTEVQAALARIQKALRTQGFMRSETYMERRVHDKELTVDVTFRSKDGPRFEMGKLTIEGLDVTTEPAIRKLWSMTPGKPFNADYPQFFLDRVREDGYLENLGRTDFTQKVNEAQKTVDVVLLFKGTPPDLQRRQKKDSEIQP